MRDTLTTIFFESHDGLPPEVSALIEQGLGISNDEAAPLHEVQAVSCFAKDEAGAVVGGAVGRSWGLFCELQQLWVDPAKRRKGIGSLLVKEFEKLAMTRGCTYFYLETFSFQAPSLYTSLGYIVQFTNEAFPHDIVKYHMAKQVGGTKTDPYL